MTPELRFGSGHLGRARFFSLWHSALAHSTGSIVLPRFKGGNEAQRNADASSGPFEHRRVKQGIGPMLGFKRIDTAEVTINGLELAAKIRKNQFK